MKHPGDPLNPKNDGDFTQTLIMFNGVAQQSINQFLVIPEPCLDPTRSRQVFLP